MNLRMELQRSTPRYRRALYRDVPSALLLFCPWLGLLLSWAGSFYLLSSHADGAPHNREDVVLADDEPFNR